VTAWRVEHLTPARRRVVTRKSFQTDERGEFRVYGLQPGKYLVSASRIAVALVDAPGGSTPALTNTGQREAPTFYPGTGNAFEAVPVEVRPGEDAAGIHIQLLATQYGAVSGVVTNSKGAPYDTAFVWLWPARADNVEFSTMQLTSPTDSQGRFRIVDVSPGDYRMEVLSRAGLEKLGQSGSMADLLGGEVASVPVTVLSGRTQEMSVRASPGFRVRGRVFVDGAPIVADLATKLTVMVQPTSSGISGMAIPVPAPLSSDGSFVASGILGNRSFSVNGSPSLYFYRTLYQSQDVSESGVDVAADTTGIEVHLTTRPSKLEGSARDGSGAVVPSGRVIVFSPDRSEWMRPATRRYRALPIRSDGTFNATGLPAGSYLAALVSLDQDRYADPDFIESLRPFATQFTISDGTTTTIELRTKK
jgi:hypothetical protein